MVSQKNDSIKKQSVSGEGTLLEVLEESQPEVEEKIIPVEYMREFISRHHLNILWEEFVYEKDHPKIPLSASEVLAMINLPPEEQDRILKNHA